MKPWQKRTYLLALAIAIALILLYATTGGGAHF
jgi:hypothetical protein